MKEDWIECEAKLLGELIRGINYKRPQSSDNEKDDYLPILRANNINENELNFDNLKFVEERLIKEEQKILTRDIVFAMSSGSKHLVGKSAQSKNNYNGSFGAFCSVYRPNENINPQFIQSYFHSTAFRQIISKASKGSNINNLKREHILNAVIPLPPQVEQKAIVKKIEELFSSLDSGIADLKKSQDQLVIYRQAVLKKAFEGELTEKKNKPEIIKLGDVIEKPRYGTSKKCTIEVKGIPVLRIPNIGSGTIDTQELKYASFEENEISNLVLKEGDILTIRSNGSVDLVGKCALITKKDINFLYAGYLIRLRPNLEKIDSKFLLYCMGSHSLRVQIESKAKSTSGVNNINSGELASLEIPIFALKEQHQIAQEIESRLSVCDKVEESIKESLEKAIALRQSILKKAFEGKLLNKEEIAKCKADAAYEPASVLLERIKEEKKK